MKIFPLLISILFLSNCASNLPYVDTFDMQKLENGMSMNDVKSALGKPIKIKGSNSEMIWEYKFRTLDNSRMKWEDPIKGNAPSVVGGESPLYCIFVNGKLTEWGSCLEGC